MKDITFEQFKEKLLFHRIVKWDENTIVLEIKNEAPLKQRFLDLGIFCAILSIYF